MKKIIGFIGVAKAVVMGGPVQILFGRATIGEKDIYEPLTINGLTPFESVEKANAMMIHLKQRQDEGISDAYLANLEMNIAENEEELSDSIFMRSNQPMIVLHRRSVTDTDFVGVYIKDIPGFPEIPGSDFQFNGLKAFDCYRDILEVSRQATLVTDQFCPIATFVLIKVPG